MIAVWGSIGILRSLSIRTKPAKFDIGSGNLPLKTATPGPWWTGLEVTVLLLEQKAYAVPTLPQF